MSISDWPQGERPRERLMAHGASALSDAELLAVLLRTGIPGASALDLAHDLLTRHRTLTGVVGASCDSPSGQRGMGPAKTAQFSRTIIRRGSRSRRAPTSCSPRR